MKATSLPSLKHLSAPLSFLKLTGQSPPFLGSQVQDLGEKKCLTVERHLLAVIFNWYKVSKTDT